MSAPKATGYVRSIERKDGLVAYAKLKLPDGSQPQRRLGKLWTKRSAPPPGYITPKQAEARRQANEARTTALLDTFRALDIDPVLVSSSDPSAILAEFLVWSDLRRTRRVVGA